MIEGETRVGRVLTLFLAGDVMTGRGIDQILPHPNEPVLFEDYVTDAREYVSLAEERHGPVPKPVGASYVWGDVLCALADAAPDARIVNLETSVTSRPEAWPGKGIHYRMHPENVACLTAARLDCCVLANNHVLDWGCGGLHETLATLRSAGIRTAGAGASLEEAAAPAVFDVIGGGRVLVFAGALTTSGVPREWAAGGDRPGVWLLPADPAEAMKQVAPRIAAVRGPRDRVVFSAHWGGNWGYHVPPGEVELAHALIDGAGVDLIHGHSSHHPKGIEVYRGRLVLYGCGDFLTDYEGIRGYGEFRPDLALGYLASIDRDTGEIVEMKMIPFSMRRLRLERATAEDGRWLAAVLSREGRRWGTTVYVASHGTLCLRWESDRQAASRVPL
jgi:poly-gamma-glutamate synthesis protein (capsule biosynthesis protein)